VRPLAIERFDVRDGHVVAVDEVVTRADIVVASPAAGGLVRIDRATGAVTVVPLAVDAGRLRRDGETVWAAAGDDDYDDEDFGDAPLRPVVWCCGAIRSAAWRRWRP
jgi:hypothetical protein